LDAVNLDDPTLRRAWAAESDEPQAAGCPDDDRTWRAVNLELPPAERAALVDHLESCPRCAESWRVAAALVERPALAPRTSAGVPAVFKIAAVLALAAVGSWIVVRQTREGSVGDRQPGGVEVRSLLEERAPLARDAFVLEWTPGPPGTIYEIEVGTSDLRSLTRAFALTEPTYTVPATALADLPAGTVVAWRVQATLPDGRVVASVTHLNPIQ
jgi:hypothetical protein